MTQINTPTYEILRDRLREEIISGRIKSGTRITIQEVANRFDVSHQPVREAFQWLKGEGIIDILPHKGAVTRVLDIDLIINIYDIRAVIEGLLAKLSTEKFKKENLKYLEQIQEELKLSITNDKCLEIVSLDYKFHTYLYQLNNNRDALKIYERYVGLLISLRRVYGFGDKRPDRLLEEHKNILNAIVNNQAELAEQLMKLHAERAKSDLITQLEKRWDL